MGRFAKKQYAPAVHLANMSETVRPTPAERAGLLESVRRRDVVAFTQLVEAFDGDLLRVAFFIAGSRQAAEDAAQTAWTRLWHSPPRLDDPSKIRSWLLTVAANEARHNRRRSQRGAELESMLPSPGIRDADPRLADLAAVVGGLHDGDRELLALRFAVGLTSQEIGDHLGLSAEGARSRLHRLLARLREDLADD